ncbi:Caleosin related protein-domain-containing protein [Boletus edulis BED1]|uniref:Caleosin related protein-domain-containing protein n=1 Tax=Boletus edulis BED1 TaxID=1328754 RepID=A0AAD4BN49_BOLED|nr:Caleosin related protein-domain-containing protein [Boletus edulis BED1]
MISEPLRSGHALEAPRAPVTQERRNRIDTDKVIERPYLPRASVAPSAECPDGSKHHSQKYRDYASISPIPPHHSSVMQQHCIYWDGDRDGVIWPLDTWRGFRDLGFNLLFCFLATIVIHATLSLPTRLAMSYIPDPFLRIYIETIHANKHGSDSGAFDTEGRFVPCKFEDMWTKYTATNPRGVPRTSMNVYELWLFTRGNRLAMDLFGWVAGFLEWVATFLLVQQDGMVDKEDVRRVLDGSLFFEIRLARKSDQGWNKGWGLGGDGFIGGEKLLPFGL